VHRDGVAARDRQRKQQRAQHRAPRLRFRVVFPAAPLPPASAAKPPSILPTHERCTDRTLLMRSKGVTHVGTNALDDGVATAKATPANPSPTTTPPMRHILAWAAAIRPGHDRPPTGSQLPAGSRVHHDQAGRAAAVAETRRAPVAFRTLGRFADQGCCRGESRSSVGILVFRRFGRMPFMVPPESQGRHDAAYCTPGRNFGQ
jgi:hypothetical protein